MASVVYYGEPGSYSEQAAIGYFGSKAKLMPFGFLSDLFDAVEKSEGYAVVPIENSIEGAVTQTYDMLFARKVHVVGEHILRVNHCLLANEGVRLKDIKLVYSHPQALGQCKEYIEKLRARAVPFYDTAGSARMVMEKNLDGAAAIASERAAKIYRLRILANGIETNKHNYTRFFIISRRHDEVKIRNKTSIVFTAKNVPGSLFNALSCFAVNKISLDYIQSRPVLGKPWEYNFYVDCEGDVKSRALRDTLYRLKEETAFVKILGSYAKARSRV